MHLATRIVAVDVLVWQGLEKVYDTNVVVVETTSGSKMVSNV